MSEPGIHPAASASPQVPRLLRAPVEQERHLSSFDKAAKAAKAGSHDSQLRQFEERWQQMFQQKQEQPLIMPTDPGRGHR